MANHIQGREVVINKIIEELLGPSPHGKEIDTSKPIIFTKPEEAYHPFVEKESGEEILQRDNPIQRYGIGVLHPFGTEEKLEEKLSGEACIGLSLQDGGILTNEVEQEKLTKNIERGLDIIETTQVAEVPDFDLSLSNAYEPSSIGISFLAELAEASILSVVASGGRYRELPVVIAGKRRTWWVRSSVVFEVEIDCSNLLARPINTISSSFENSKNTEGLDLKIEVFSRPYKAEKNLRLITVCLVNRTKEVDSSQSALLFQSTFKAKIVVPSGNAYIMPYPGPDIKRLDDEEKSLELLYRNAKTFAIGHGCAANWGPISCDRVMCVSTDCLPVTETPNITPDIFDKNGKPITISMKTLAGLDSDVDSFEALNRIIEAYRDWIFEKEKEINSIDVSLQEIAQHHLEACKKCAERMQDGISFLHSDPIALLAFQQANYAILLQQLHSRSELRKVKFDEKSKRFVFSEEYLEPSFNDTKNGRGTWRAFQIAFLLMSIRSSVDHDISDRDIVELIWFPTGGGKTEAYLGLTAFVLFMRRFANKNDIGTHVLMRYTLRLLTTQQFQRAARLVCAMEFIRRKNPTQLGSQPFSIGLWVGGNNTPNKRNEAKQILKGLYDGTKQVDNKFVIDRCPWCGAQMGPLENQSQKTNKQGYHTPKIIGYSEAYGTVIFKCPELKCEFNSGLPILVIDEDIYENPPSIVIGTVDKFAMLAWQPSARTIFGIDTTGKRVNSPPGLIIQDELHLISGPLGSLVGLYETVIEELCTDRRQGKQNKPKIISSTATIRRYRDQIKALYGRDKVVLFPPPGLDEGDSFFARYAKDDLGHLLPGRKYLGVHAPGLGSMQTVQVRTFTALLQAPMSLQEDMRDPWWTLLIFFNSLRELGTTLSLIQSDIPDYQQVVMNRQTTLEKKWRSFYEVKELTGRASNDDIPRSIAALERKYPNDENRPVDICLASNILEVGIDIDRLSLISVVGQPKTTSQYIQVTGRIGRNWKERPGLVITLYSASKPRDRSHFEKFRSYHERLYAQVEPTSITPFSSPALDRALHAVMVAYILQTGSSDTILSPYPFPQEAIEELRKILIPRVQVTDNQELQNFCRVFDKRAKEWKDWKPIKWKAQTTDLNPPLTRAAGAYAPPEWDHQSWPTMQSMRSVDAECITELVKPSQISQTNKRGTENAE